MGANHALCAYVCRCEILATFRNKARINNGRSLLCAAFHSPHLHQLYRKRECAWIENSLSLSLLFFFHFFSIDRGEKRKENEESNNKCTDTRYDSFARICQFFSSRFVDLAKLSFYRNEVEKGMLAQLGKFYQFSDFLALVQPQSRETRQSRLFFSTIGTRYMDLRFSLYFSWQFDSPELRSTTLNYYFTRIHTRRASLSIDKIKDFPEFFFFFFL